MSTQDTFKEKSKESKSETEKPKKDTPEDIDFEEDFTIEEIEDGDVQEDPNIKK